MRLLILVLCLWQCLVLALCEAEGEEPSSPDNSTDPNKDMYVIHAMVYQVGILTNKTDSANATNTTSGNQEALTLYHSGGSPLELGALPPPLLTNVTAQSLVGVAPAHLNNTALPWDQLQHLAAIPTHTDTTHTDASPRSRRSLEGELPMLPYVYLVKRSAAEDGPGGSVRVEQGSALVPPDAGVHSLALPPLLALNHNLTHIPVPIPNTSVVRYAKINTLLKSP